MTSLKHNDTPADIETHSDTILVTGANGLIGRWLVPALLNQGYRVVAAMRNAPQREQEFRGFINHKLHQPQSDQQRLQLLEFSLEHTSQLFQQLHQPRPGLRPLSAHITGVFHLAAAFSWGLKQADTQRVNVKACDVLVDQVARLPKLQRFVWIGGYRVGHESGRTEAELYRKLGAYEASKLIAHQRMLNKVAALNIPWTAVHPSSVIGDSQTGETTQFIGMAEMVEQLHKGKLPAIPGGSDTFVPLVHVDFVAEFCARLLQHPQSDAEQYWLLDDNTPNLKPLLQRIAHHLQVPCPRMQLPVWLLKIVPAALLPGSKESLNFISNDRYPTGNTQALAQQMGIANLLPLNHVEAWVDNLVAQQFGHPGAQHQAPPAAVSTNV